MSVKLTDAEILRTQRAAVLYDNQWGLIAPIEFPGKIPNTLSSTFRRIPQNWQPKEGTELLPLRIEEEPERVAQEVSKLIKDAGKSSNFKMPTSLQRFLAGQNKDIKSEKREQTEEELIEWLRYKTQGLEKANADLRLKVGAQKELGVALAAAVKASDPFPRYVYSGPKVEKVSVEPALMLSDWHVGEVIQYDEMEGFNEYSYQIAEDRIFDIIDSFLKWVEVQRKIYHIRNLSVFALGDWVSGNIHQELIATNEFPLPVQTAKAGLLFGEVLCRLGTRFNKVTVHEVGADNHGRLQPKPQAKQKASNSMSFLVHTIANQVTEKQGNIFPNIAAGMKMVVEVANHNFLLEHGDTVKAYMGTPYYGMNRERGREAIKRMGTDKVFHYQGLAHWHVPAFLEGSVIVNGSLSGTSEFDHSQGRYADPAQVAFMVHPKHGMFNYTPFNSDR